MTTRPTTVRRTPWYMGPSGEIDPTTLSMYERPGWVAQEKMDGMWSMFTVGNKAEGRLHDITSRDARTGSCSGSAVGDLLTLDIPLPEGTIVVGELEAASQWSTQQNARLGYRRVHLFDLVRIGFDEDLRDLSTEDRMGRLEQVMLVLHKDPVLASRFPRVRTVTSGFRAFFDQIMSEKGEGIVLKQLSSQYRVTNQSGKTDKWLRCKKLLTDDFVLIGFGMTPGGKTCAPSKTGVWGLWDTAKDKYVEVLRAGTDDDANLLIDAHIGLVAEFKGNERFKSGALKHARFVRVRPDKQAAECLLP